MVKQQQIKKIIGLLFGVISTQIIVFYGLTLIARAFGPNYIGYQSYFYTIISFVAFIAQLGFNQVGLKLLLQGQNKRNVVTNMIFHKLLFFLFLVPIFSTFYWLRLIDSTILIGLCAVSLTVLNVEYVYQFEKKFLQLGLLKLFGAMLFVLCVIYMRYFFDDWMLNAAFPYILLLVSSVILGFILQSRCIDLRVVKFDLNMVKSASLIALSLISTQFLLRLDKVFLAQISGFDALGYYDIAMKIYNIIYNISALVVLVLVPYVKDDIKILKKSALQLTILFLLLSPILALFSNALVVNFFGSEFELSASILRFLIPSLLFASLNLYFISFLNINGNEKVTAKILVFLVLIKLPLSFITISYFSVIGAVISMTFVDVTICFYMIKFISSQHYVNLRCSNDH